MKEELIKVVVGAVFTVGSCVYAWIKGRSKKKVTINLTQAQQEEDLRQYMVKSCKSKESFSKFLKTSMSKEELSEYKHSEVLKELTMYAKANQYDWFNTGVWSDKIKDYIADANATAGKFTNQVANKHI